MITNETEKVGSAEAQNQSQAQRLEAFCRKVLPCAFLARDFVHGEDGGISFEWKGSRYKVSHALCATEVKGDRRFETDAALLMSELLIQRRLRDAEKAAHEAFDDIAEQDVRLRKDVAELLELDDPDEPAGADYFERRRAVIFRLKKNVGYEAETSRKKSDL